MVYARHASGVGLNKDEDGNISGTIPAYLSTDDDKLCYECLVPKKEGQMHCNLCKVCVEGMDHHCIFYGKCIGKNNIKTFNASIVVLIMNAVYLFVMLGAIGFT